MFCTQRDRKGCTTLNTHFLNSHIIGVEFHLSKFGNLKSSENPKLFLIGDVMLQLENSIQLWEGSQALCRSVYPDSCDTWPHIPWVSLWHIAGTSLSTVVTARPVCITHCDYHVFCVYSLLCGAKILLKISKKACRYPFGYQWQEKIQCSVTFYSKHGIVGADWKPAVAVLGL